MPLKLTNQYTNHLLETAQTVPEDKQEDYSLALKNMIHMYQILVGKTSTTIPEKAVLNTLYRRAERIRSTIPQDEKVLEFLAATDDLLKKRKYIAPKKSTHTCNLSREDNYQLFFSDSGHRYYSSGDPTLNPYQ